MPSQLASVPPISCSSTTDGPSPASSKWMLMPLASIQGTGFSSRRGGAHRGMGAGKIQHEVMPSPVAAAQASDIMQATAGVGRASYDGIDAQDRRALPPDPAVLSRGGLLGGAGPRGRQISGVDAATRARADGRARH